MSRRKWPQPDESRRCPECRLIGVHLGNCSLDPDPVSVPVIECPATAAGRALLADAERWYPETSGMHPEYVRRTILAIEAEARSVPTRPEPLTVAVLAEALHRAHRSLGFGSCLGTPDAWHNHEPEAIAILAALGTSEAPAAGEGYPYQDEPGGWRPIPDTAQRPGGE